MQFTVWLTYDCNLQCTYCYEGEIKNHGKMSLDTAKEVLDFIHRQINVDKSTHEFDSIVFHGGEPLLNYEVMQYMIENFRSWETKVPLYMSTTTNAVLLTKEKAAYLTDILNEISVSIDGTKQTNDIHRISYDGIGSYEWIITNIQELLKNKNKSCELRARMTVTPTTAKWLYENVDFLVRLGFTTVVPIIDNFSDWSEEETSRLYQEMVKVYERIAEKREDLLLGLIDDVSTRHASFCLAGEETMHLSPDGFIFPCAYVMGQDDFIFGDVRSGILTEKVEWLKNINSAPMVDSCMSCSWRPLCFGNRCRLLNYAITGDFSTPSVSTCMDEHLHLKMHSQCYAK